VPLLVLCAALACGQTKTSDPTPSAQEPPSAPPLKAAEKLLDPGSQAPLFSLLAHTGMSAELQRFLGKPVVVLFCPNLGATNCESTLLALRDAWFGLRSKLGMVLMVSAEERVRLREFAYANELPFLLLSDGEGAVTRAYGVGAAGSSGVQLFVIAPNKAISTRLPEPSPEAVRQWLSSL
jgi:peroxiredoxin Q/BCP